MASRNQTPGDGGLIEWVTISYQTLKFWGLLGFLLLLGLGAFYAFRYFTVTVDESHTKSSKTLESRSVRLLESEGQVQVKQLNQSNWVPAQRVKMLNVGDMINTGPNSWCKLMYFDGTNVQIRENTLYVVMESSVNPGTDAQTIRGEITSGEVHMATPERRHKDTSVKLSTQEAEAALAGNTEAAARRNKEAGQSDFFVYQGGAKVLSKKDNKTTTLSANEQVSVSKASGPANVQPIPAPPEIIEPQVDEPLLVKELPAQVELRWKPVDGIHQYRVRVSDQPTFSAARYNQIVKTTSFRLNNLGPGTYYWQIYSINDQGVESSARSSKFFLSSSKIKRYGSPIRLDVENVVSMGEIYELIGRTDPGVRLTVNGKAADVQANGRFKIFTDPIGSAKSLEIVARDIAGNITSKTILTK